MEVKIIWDQSFPHELFGKSIKSIIVADKDAEQGAKTAYLDLYDNNITRFKQGDKLRLLNSYSKLIKNDKNQFRITNTMKIELIEDVTPQKAQ